MGGTAQPITTQTPPPQAQGFDPIAELRTRYPGVAQEPDEKVYNHLSNPANFRAAFPEYAHLDDETITRNMASHAPSEQARQGVVPPAGAQPMKAQTETQFEKDREGATPTLFGGSSQTGGGVLSNFWDAIKNIVPSMKDGGTPANPADYDTSGLSSFASQQMKSGEQAAADDQQRAKEGRSKLYRGTVVASEAAQLPINARKMEEAADVGNKRAIVGQGLGSSTVAAAPLIAEGVSKVAKPATKAVSAVAKPIAKVATDVGKSFTIGMPGEEMLKKGLSPYAKQTGYDAAVAKATDDIVKYHKENPIKSVKDLDEAIPEIQKKIQTEEIDPAVKKHADEELAPERMARVKKAVEDSVSPFTKEFDEAGAKSVADLAEKMGKTRTVGEALGGGRGGLLGYINGQLESYFSKYPSARRSDLMTNPDTAGWAAARSALRTEVLDHLKEAGEPGMGEARARWGALEELSKTTERRVNQADRVKPMSLPRILGLVGAPATAGLSVVAGEVANHLNKTDVLVRRGVDRMAKNSSAIDVTPTPARPIAKQLPPPAAPPAATPAKPITTPPKTPPAPPTSTASKAPFERRANTGNSPTGAERRNFRLAPETDERMALRVRLEKQAKDMTLTPEERKLAQDRYDDIVNHPDEQNELTDINKMKAAGKKTLTKEEAEANTAKRAEARTARFGSKKAEPLTH